MELKIMPVVVAVDMNTRKTGLLKDLRRKKKELKEIKISSVVISTDFGKETVDIFSFPGNLIYVDLERVLSILEVNQETLIDCVGVGAIASYNKKLYVNSCNLIRAYNNISTDRGFYTAVLNLSTRVGSEKNCDKLQLTCEVLEAIKKVKGALDAYADKESKCKFYTEEEQDYLHDIENDCEDEDFIDNLKVIRYRRRKSKNDLSTVKVVKEFVKEQELNKMISKITKTIEINRKKVYIKRVKAEL